MQEHLLPYGIYSTSGDGQDLQWLVSDRKPGPDNLSKLSLTFIFRRLHQFIIVAVLLESQLQIMSSKAIRQKAQIELTVCNSANLVNNSHLVCVAANYVPTGLERPTILNHLKAIEDMTGWKTVRLETLWGL